MDIPVQVREPQPTKDLAPSGKTPGAATAVAEPVGPPPLVVSGEPESEAKSVNPIWDKVIRGFLYALTFLLPLLFTPWTFEPLELSKQMVLFILVTGALGTWLLKLLVTRSWQMVKTPLDMPVWIFVLIYFLASLFSVDRISSFLGFYGTFSGNFFQALFLVLLYYLIVNNFQTFDRIKKLLATFYAAVFIATMYILLQFFGIFVFHFPFAKATNFNTVGGLLTVSLFAAFAILLSLGMKSERKSWFAFGTGLLWRILTVVGAFVILLTVNFIYAWAALLVGLLLYLIFHVGMAKSGSLKEFITPLVMTIFVVAVLVMQWVFPFLPLQSIFRFNLPVEVRLDYPTAKPVVWAVVTHKPILGSGPDTFLYSFSQYKAQNFNLSPFWNVRFDKAPSEALEYLVGTGIVGFLAFEIMAVIFLIYGVFFLLRKKTDEPHWNLALAIFSSFVVLWVAHWFFFFDTVLVFSFWLMLGAFVAISRIADGEKAKVQNFSFATSPRRTVSLVSLVSLFFVFMIVFVFFAAAIYASDIFYYSGLVASNNPNSYNQAQADFEQAVRLNRFRPDYYLSYGEFLFLRINQELTKPKPNLPQVQQWLASSINTARAAVDLSPANWTAWERLANLYTSAQPLVAGVNDFVISSLSKATEQDPNNPILWTELGQVYRLNARKIDPAILGTGPDSDNDGLSDSQEVAFGCDPHNPSTTGDGILDGAKVLAGLSCSGPGPLPDAILNKYLKTDPSQLLKAEGAFKKAVALKPDYATAYYQLALTYEQSNKLGDAIDEMKQVLQRFPTNVDLKFELGRMLFNDGLIADAAQQFREIVVLSPSNANAWFSLALSDERSNPPQLESALQAYQKVLELNPGNQAIQTKIQQLETQVHPGTTQQPPKHK